MGRAHHKHHNKGHQRHHHKHRTVGHIIKSVGHDVYKAEKSQLNLATSTVSSLLTTPMLIAGGLGAAYLILKK